MKTFASRYKIERSKNKRGKIRYKIRNLVTGNLAHPTAIYDKREHAAWPLAVLQDIEMRAAGLTDRDVLDIRHIRVMNKREIKRGTIYRNDHRESARF